MITRKKISLKIKELNKLKYFIYLNRILDINLENRKVINYYLSKINKLKRNRSILAIYYIIIYYIYYINNIITPSTLKYFSLETIKILDTFLNLLNNSRIFYLGKKINTLNFYNLGTKVGRFNSKGEVYKYTFGLNKSNVTGETSNSIFVELDINSSDLRTAISYIKDNKRNLLLNKKDIYGYFSEKFNLDRQTTKVEILKYLHDSNIKNSKYDKFLLGAKDSVIEKCYSNKIFKTHSQYLQFMSMLNNTKLFYTILTSSKLKDKYIYFPINYKHDSIIIEFTNKRGALKICENEIISDLKSILKNQLSDIPKLFLNCLIYKEDMKNKMRKIMLET